MTLLKNIKLVRISTVAFFIDTQLSAQIKMTISAGAVVSVIASESSLNRPIDSCQYFSIDIPRQIRPIKDLIALLKLWRLFRNQGFDIVHSTTPKAGLLSAIAGRLSGVPIRVHTFTGQPWVTLKGIKRHTAKLSDKLIGILSTACYADSYSQKNFLVSEKLVQADKLFVIGQGSLAGVDINRFNPDLFNLASRYAIKEDLGIAKNAVVLLFVGRIVRDKGVVELVEAFNSVITKNSNVYLLFVGPLELSKEDLGIIVGSSVEEKIKFVGYTDFPEKYMAVSDVLCIPSYREGFGTVVIEAAAMGLPAVGSNIYGLSDAIVNGKTGILVEPRSSKELEEALFYIITDGESRMRLGNCARQRVVDDFSSEFVNKDVVKEYVKLLAQTRDN